MEQWSDGALSTSLDSLMNERELASWASRATDQYPQLVLCRAEVCHWGVGWLGCQVAGMRIREGFAEDPVKSVRTRAAGILSVLVSREQYTLLSVMMDDG